ncbi:MAG TPA: hypothetical protein VJA40_03475, partial [archaeon]|nr:hypothetical protein [archaeon]
LGLNALSQLALVTHYALPLDSIVVAIANVSGSKEWEASAFYHVHSLKPAVSFALEKLGVTARAADTGEPMRSTVPYSDYFSVLALALVALTAYYLFKEARGWGPAARIEHLVLVVASAGVLIGVLDGGIASQNTRVGLLLMAAYHFNLAPRKPRLLGKAFIACLALAVLVFAASFAFTTAKLYDEKFATPKPLYSEFFELNALAVALAAMLAGREKSGKKKKAFLFLGLLAAAPFALIVWSEMNKTFMYKYDEVDLFVYGLSSGAEDKEVVKALQRVGDVKEFERIEWSAAAKVIMWQDTSQKKIVKELQQNLPGSPFVYAEPSFGRKQFAFRALKGAEESRLLGLESAFVAVSMEGNNAVVSSRLGLWGVPFILDYLNKETRKPVTAVIAFNG